MERKAAISGLLLLVAYFGFAQTNTQSIKGSVKDYVTGEALIGATASIEGSDPIIGSITDVEGNYVLKNVNVGRHVLLISYIGYKPVRIPEILLTSAKPFLLDVKLEEDQTSLGEVVVTARQGKEAYNTMASVSARSFTIEESSRFAGGLSDPSRVAYNFAGVTFSSPQDNGVVIRGNSPTNVLWRVNDHGMHATAEDVGIFLRALNDGSLFEPGEQEVYASIYEFKHAGWVPGYQSFATYNQDLDAVIITFYSTTDEKLYYWNLSEIINNRIAKILRKQKSF